MVRIGVVGYGYWGPNLVRNFAETTGAELVAVSDLDPKKLETVKKRYPTVRTTTRFQELLDCGHCRHGLTSRERLGTLTGPKGRRR